DLVPLGRNLLPAQSTGGLHVLFEGVEVADGGWVQNGWAEVDFVERILGMPARDSTAGEERLQRLCRELDDGVALDDPRPAALELQIFRSEHAEFHDTLVSVAYPCLAPGRVREARLASENAESRASLVTVSYRCLAPVRSASPW